MKRLLVFGIVVFAIIILFSCNRASEIKKIVAGNEYKYWDAHSQRYGKVTGAFKMQRGGHCQYYIYPTNRPGKRELFNSEDVVFENHWAVEEKRFYLRGNYLRILQMTSDTILLQSETSSYTLLLTKSPDQTE